MTKSAFGGLPLGDFITSSESTESTALGLKMVKDLVGDIAFFERGSEGPIAFMVDGSDVERQALDIVWPESRVLGCIFHVLQCVWRWLSRKQSGVAQKDRYEVFSSFMGTLKDHYPIFKFSLAYMPYVMKNYFKLSKKLH